MRRKLPHVDEIVRLYSSGLTLDEIARQYGCAQGATCVMALKKAGVVLPKRHYGRARQSAEIITRYRAGLPTKRVAECCGVTPETVLNVLRRNGVEVDLYRHGPSKIFPSPMALKAEHDAGLSFGALAKKYGCDLSSVSRHLSRHGIRIKPHVSPGRRGPIVTRAMMMECAQCNLTKKETARKLCVSYRTVWNAEKRYGIRLAKDRKGRKPKSGKNGKVTTHTGAENGATRKEPLDRRSAVHGHH